MGEKNKLTTTCSLFVFCPIYIYIQKINSAMLILSTGPQDPYKDLVDRLKHCSV